MHTPPPFDVFDNSPYQGGHLWSSLVCSLGKVWAWVLYYVEFSLMHSILFRFESYNSLIKHKKRLHAVIKTQYRCEECSKTYSDAKALKAHIESIHKRSAELHCNQCERIFSSKYALNRHKNEVHKKIVQHTCEQCGKSFAQFSNMKIHMRTHTGVKPFQCRHNPALCRVAFTTKQCLQVGKYSIHPPPHLHLPFLPSSVSAELS